MNICVYGAASSNIDKSYFDAAEKMGELIAKMGYGLVYGGGLFGLMGAAAKGAKKLGGRVTGVAPKFFKPDGVLYDECDEFIYTETMRERKQKMEEFSDAFVVMPGGIGTMEEFLEIFTLRQLGRHNKPIAVLNTNGYYDDMAAMLGKAVNEGFMSEISLSFAPVLRTPEEVMSYLMQQL